MQMMSIANKGVKHALQVQHTFYNTTFNSRLVGVHYTTLAPAIGNILISY